MGVLIWWGDERREGEAGQIGQEILEKTKVGTEKNGHV